MSKNKAPPQRALGPAPRGRHGDRMVMLSRLPGPPRNEVEAASLAQLQCLRLSRRAGLRARKGYVSQRGVPGKARAASPPWAAIASDSPKHSTRDSQPAGWRSLIRVLSRMGDDGTHGIIRTKYTMNVVFSTRPGAAPTASSRGVEDSRIVLSRLRRHDRDHEGAERTRERRLLHPRRETA